MDMGYDVIIKGGLYFDGTGRPASVQNLGIRDGRVVTVSPSPLDERGAGKVVDAEGKWVVPGFVDLHTHYDAEVLATPSLSESIRHGVTTVTVGSCSIGTVLADAEDCSDLFTRVESVPREHVLPLLREKKTWASAKDYVAFLEGHPLGPNVTAFLGHSDLRARVLGLGRSVDGDVRPTKAELEEMERHLGDALDAGLLGLSTMTNPWDKLDGDRFRSAQLPSTYATWGEYRRLHAVLRERGAILQSAPSLVTKVNALLFMLESAGLFFRKSLRTTLITLADAKSSQGLHRVLATVTQLVNRFLGGDLRWQTLPVPFEVYADGIDLVVFEEFGAGEAALHLANEVERNALMQDPEYRRSFRRDYEKKWSPRVWQRDFFDAEIVACPDATVVGKTFGAVADTRKVHPVDAFLDLVVEHGKKLRWRTTIANHRPREVERMVNEPAALVGFADSGAHIRNMAFYSFPLRFLRLVRDAALEGRTVMPIEKAVHRVTGEIADFLGVDAGHLREGDRADVCVIDPTALDARLDAYHEANMEGFGDLARMVNRSTGTVSCVLVNGRVAFEHDERGERFTSAFGKERGFGHFLPGKTKKIEAVVAATQPKGDAPRERAVSAA